MAEEKKDALDSKDEGKKEGEESQEESETEEGEEESKEDSQNLNWKKIAEDERLRREKAERALTEQRLASKKDKTDDEKDETDDEDKPLTGNELRSILQEERKITQREFLYSRIREIARSLAASDDEADAVVAIFNNRSFPETLSLDEQVKEAFYIAHGPRLTAKILELRRSLRGKEGTKKSGAEDAHRDEPKGNEPKLSPQDKAELERLGFVWDGKQYSKKLSGGKTLVRDWKTKKTFIK